MIAVVLVYYFFQSIFVQCKGSLLYSIPNLFLYGIFILFCIDLGGIQVLHKLFLEIWHPPIPS